MIRSGLPFDAESIAEVQACASHGGALAFDVSPPQRRLADADLPTGQQVLDRVAGMGMMAYGQLAAITEHALRVEHDGRGRQRGAEDVGRRPRGIEQDRDRKPLGLEELAYTLRRFAGAGI